MRLAVTAMAREGRQRVIALAGRAAAAVRQRVPADRPQPDQPDQPERAAPLPSVGDAAMPDAGEEALRDLIPLVAELGTFDEFSAVMRRHLDSVCTETANASSDILRLASALESQVHGLVGYIGGAAQAPDFVAATGRARSAVDAGLMVIAQLERQRATRRAELEKDVGAVHVLSANMLNALRGIDRIRLHTEMLAINVGIAASRSGEAGVGLDPLAFEIRRLAQETGELSQAVRQQAVDIDGMLSASLTRRLEREAAEEAESSERLSASFRHVSDSMSAVVELQQAMIDRAHRDSAGMTDPLMALCASVQFQDVTRQQIDQVGRSLEAVTRHIVDLSQAAEAGEAMPTSSIQACLAATSSNYVMDRQREAHGDAPAPALAAIELF